MSGSSNPLRSYRPGTWFGLVGERAVVALPPSEKSRVPALWELVDEGAGFDVTLDALISGGLRDLPGFVLVSTDEGQTDVVIRGPAVARFTVAGEEVVVEGSSATTWAERSLQGVEWMQIELEPAGDGSAPPYVVDGGLFRVSQLEETRADGEAAHRVRALHVVESPETDGVVALPVAEAPVEDVDVVVEDADPEDAEPEDAEPEGEAPIWQPADDSAEVPVRSPEPPSWTPEPPADHDGLTLTGVPLPPPPPPPVMPPPPPMPPPPADSDSGSGSGSAGEVPEPVARLIISSGQTVDVDQVTVIGRAPESKQYPDGQSPRLVTVPSAHYEISSTHIEVRPGSGADRGTAVITDLGSTNGTVVVQPGVGPQDLAPGEPVPLLHGALIDIGDGITIQVARPEH